MGFAWSIKYKRVHIWLHNLNVHYDLIRDLDVYHLCSQSCNGNKFSSISSFNDIDTSTGGWIYLSSDISNSVNHVSHNFKLQFPLFSILTFQNWICLGSFISSWNKFIITHFPAKTDSHGSSILLSHISWQFINL